MIRFLSLVVLLGCAQKAPPSPSVADPTSAVPPPVTLNAEAVAGVTDPALRDLLHRHWESVMASSPTWATTLGDHRFDDRLRDVSAEAVDAQRARTRDFLAEARALPADGLDEADSVTHRLFMETLEYDIAEEVCEMHRWGLSPRWNVYTSTARMPEELVPDDPVRAKALLARYRALPGVIDATTANLRSGASDGLVANAATVRLVIDQLETELAKPLEEWPLHGAIPASEPLPEAEGAAFRSDIEAVLREGIAPAYRRFLEALKQDILPVARGEGKEGLAALPLGEACYQAKVRSFTTLPEATADERHQAGLEALKGIHTEFREIGARALGTEDLAEIFARLRTDPELYFETEDEVEAKAVDALARAREAMPSAFGRLPETPCVVERIPEVEAPYTTIAYYMPPQEGEPGRYFVNTWKPETRPRHEAEVLAYHESIPGHHLQIAIAQELPDVPAFRRYGGMTAFVEGWGLYTERLADELGLYSGDLDRLGMLSFDAWRASRLVVDTGIHAKGWSREQAEAFLVENTPLAKNNIANEVDRYITTPGQALAYKTGQAELWRLRRDAEARLGERFDLKGFHDTVLGAGAVSLPVLRERVEAWVVAREG